VLGLHETIRQNNAHGAQDSAISQKNCLTRKYFFTLKLASNEAELLPASSRLLFDDDVFRVDFDVIGSLRVA